MELLFHLKALKQTAEIECQVYVAHLYLHNHRTFQKTKNSSRKLWAVALYWCTVQSNSHSKTDIYIFEYAVREHKYQLLKHKI